MEGRTLDGFLLLAAGGSQFPNDIIKCNLSSLNIVEIVSDDLSYFLYLNELDLSDNQLDHEKVIEELATLPKITDLRLSCNKISQLHITPNFLPLLVSLDLSYNELHGDIFMHLCHLKKLRYLNLSSNCVSSIPPEEYLTGFFNLEELILDGNDLVQFAQWRQLDCITSLKKLSLSANRIKRLLDDCPEDGNEMFRGLEELNISDNEIAELESLDLLLFFQSLQRVQIDKNPLASQPSLPEKIGHFKLALGENKDRPWYMRDAKFIRDRDMTDNKPKRINGCPTKYKKKEMKSVKVNKIEMSAWHPQGDQALDSYDQELQDEVSYFLKTGGFKDYKNKPDYFEMDDEKMNEDFTIRKIKSEAAYKKKVSNEPDTYQKKVPFQLSEETLERQARLRTKYVKRTCERQKRFFIPRSVDRKDSIEPKDHAPSPNAHKEIGTMITVNNAQPPERSFGANLSIDRNERVSKGSTPPKRNTAEPQESVPENAAEREAASEEKESIFVTEPTLDAEDDGDDEGVASELSIDSTQKAVFSEAVRADVRDAMAALRNAMNFPVDA